MSISKLTHEAGDSWDRIGRTIQLQNMEQALRITRLIRDNPGGAMEQVLRNETPAKVWDEVQRLLAQEELKSQ